MNSKPKLFLLLTIFAAALAAQSGASITGIVTDPQGRAVPGATITLFSSTGASGGATTTDGSGRYRLDGLPDGAYLLQAEAPGFASFLADAVHLTSGATAMRDIELKIAGMTGQVVVTASGTPQAPEIVSKAVTAIDQSDVDARDASSVASAVSVSPGVQIEQLGGPGSFTAIRIRGLRDQDTSILVDGLRLRDASATQADASELIGNLLWTDASQVEVVRGSGSALYGTNAIGGVVNIITNEGGGRNRGSLLVEGGSLGTFRGRFQFSGGALSDKIQYSMGVAHLDITSGVDGDAPFRDTSAQGRVTFHLSRSIRLIARLYGSDAFGKTLGEPDIIGTPSGLGIVNAVPLPGNLLRSLENGTPLSQINTGNATFIPAPDNPDGTLAARFITGALILNGQPSTSFDYSISYQIVSTARRYGDGPAGLGYQPLSNTRSVYDGRIQTADAQAHYHLGRFNLLSAGYEFETETYAFDSSDASDLAANSAANVTQKSNTVFVQDQAGLFDQRLQLTAAVRGQFFLLDAPGFYPAASAPYQGVAFSAPPPAYTWDASAAYFFRRSGTKLRAHVGRGYRAPSLYERFGAGFDPVYGYTVYGDPRLAPEHSLGMDAGIDQTLFHGRVQASASYFYTWLQNTIDFDTTGLINPATDPYGRFIGYLNAPGGISRGFELSATAAPTSKVRATVAYTYVNAMERTPLVGDVLQTFLTPRNQFSIVATGQLTSRLTLVLDSLDSSSYLDPIYGTYITQTFRFGGIHKVNLGASYRIPRKEYQAIRLFARAENVFNQTYFSGGFLTAGRTGTGGVEFEF